jgi:isoleucyl-tRNA synthetase
VRLNRRRFWKGEMGPDKLAAYHTLHQCLVVVTRLSAPVAPFFSDRLHRDLAGSSVHLSDWPVADKGAVDAELEARTKLAQSLTSLVLSIRKKEGHRVRQPLQRILVPVLDKKMRERLLAVKELVLGEVNVKELELLDPSQSRLTRKIKADFKKLGARLGKLMKSVAAVVNTFDQQRIADLEEKGSLMLDVEGQQVELRRDEVEITAENVPGLSVASEGRLTVALDIELNDALIQEGIARELVSRIQTLRKENGFEVTDRIDLHIKRNGNLLFESAIRSHAGHIRTETLAMTPEDELLVESLPPEGPVHEVELDTTHTCALSLSRSAN